MSPQQNSSAVLNEISDICVIGDEDVGKSSLVVSYVYDQFIEHLEHTDDETYVKEVREGSSVGEISILDAASQKDNYASSRRQQMTNTSGFLFTYSIADHDSFLEVEDLFERIYAMRDEMPPVVLVGLKSDLEDERQVGYQEGVALSERMKAIDFVECSSKMGHEVHEAFDALVKIILQEKKSCIFKPSDLLSLQSLREVLSSPMDSEQKTIPSTPEKLASNYRTSTKFDADSMSIDIPKINSPAIGSKRKELIPCLDRLNQSDDTKANGRGLGHTVSVASSSDDEKSCSRCCIIM